MNERFVGWFRGELDRSGLGVADAARAIGVSQSMVSTWYNGRTAPSLKSLRKLAAWSGRARADLEALIDDDDGAGHRGTAFAVSSPRATVRIDDPELVSVFFGILERWPRLTPAERRSLLADEREIVPPGRANGGGLGAGSGEPGDGGAAVGGR